MNESGRTPLILVVDDTPFNAKLLEAMLQQHGYQVALAHSGTEALTRIRENRPNLVLLDVVMPDLDGYEVCRRIRSDPITQVLPVIMVTSSDEPDRVHSLEAGADDFLIKPVQRAELMARVKSLLRIESYHQTMQTQARELAQWAATLEQRVRQQVEELNRMKRLRRFLSPQLADVLVSVGGEAILRSHRRQIAVAYCRLQGFRALVETIAPEEVMHVLSEYHQVVGQLIHSSGGTVGTFSGDAVMSFFNDPLPCADPAVPAVQMVLAARNQLGDMTRQWARRGHNLTFAMAVTLGYATIGEVGFEDRVDYGAVGTVVDLADALCDRAEPGQILITPPVYAAVEDLVEVTRLGEVQLAGFVRPVSAFNIERERLHDDARQAADPEGNRLELLSLREREVAALVARGFTNRQIAEELVISERTAEGHVEHIREKLGVHTRAEVAVWVVQTGLVPAAESA